MAHLGDVNEVYLTGDFAKGISSNNIIDLEFVGNVNVAYVVHLVNKVEPLINKKIRYVVYSNEEFAALKTDLSNKKLLIWTR